MRTNEDEEFFEGVKAWASDVWIMMHPHGKSGSEATIFRVVEDVQSQYQLQFKEESTTHYKGILIRWDGIASLALTWTTLQCNTCPNDPLNVSLQSKEKSGIFSLL